MIEADVHVLFPAGSVAEQHRYAGTGMLRISFQCPAHYIKVVKIIVLKAVHFIPAHLA